MLPGYVYPLRPLPENFIHDLVTIVLKDYSDFMLLFYITVNLHDCQLQDFVILDRVRFCTKISISTDKSQVFINSDC